MKKEYIVQIGNMNGQSNYNVIAESSRDAKEKAKKMHLDSGRCLDNKNIYIAFERPYRANA